MLPVVAALLFGSAIGIGAYAFIYAEGHSYLTNDPAACMNCHIMRDQYASWTRSSHHTVAVCNDCHTPGNFVEKYAGKASNGFWHSFAFTTQRFPEPIRIKPKNLKRAESACRNCHMPLLERSVNLSHAANETSCIRCHSAVGHAP